MFMNNTEDINLLNQSQNKDQPNTKLKHNEHLQLKEKQKKKLINFKFKMMN